MLLDEMYRDVILDHYRYPRGRKPIGKKEEKKKGEGRKKGPDPASPAPRPRARANARKRITPTSQWESLSVPHQKKCVHPLARKRGPPENFPKAGMPP